MTTVYHSAVSASVTSPYIHIPTVELVRQYLCANPVGTWIETSVRKLARVVGRSEGQMSYHLKQLADDGWIAVASDARGTLIEVLRSDSSHDRLENRSCDTSAPEPDSLHDRFQADQSHDRSDVLRKKHDSCSSSSMRAHDDFSERPAHPLVPILQEHGASKPVIQAILATCPNLTPGELLSQFAAARRRPSVRNVAAFVFGLLMRGERVALEPEITPTQEQRHATHQPRRHANTATPRRTSHIPANFGMEWLVPANAAVPGV